MKIRPAKKTDQVVMELNRRDEPLLKEATTAPFRIGKILVPTDFSTCAKKALDYAVPFAAQHDAELILLYAAPAPSYAGGEYGVIDTSAMAAEISANSEQRLADFAAAEIPSDIKVETIVRAGSPTAEILDVAEKLAVDMIVLSTHGHTGLKHVLLGSVAEHVVRHAPCPVLVVREKEHEFLA